MRLRTRFADNRIASAQTTSEQIARPQSSNERGSGTVMSLGIIAVLLILAVAVAGLIGALAANHRALSAADLSALAAADAARGLRSGEPCEVAAQVARQNKAELVNCVAPAQHSGTIDVRVNCKISGPFAALGPAEAGARAGPPQQ
ncbi:MAG: flp pilus-assembly TadE/G-like family protein [Rothia sp. (in: high G+C Gram-positive bacteria)]|nr:flp pilus-assembly TadE/G-like family protein [Rothia sp. (in: high G+C Gram-positive bacteria)]